MGVYILTRASSSEIHGLIEDWVAAEEALDSALDERAIERIRKSVECPGGDITPEGVRRISEALED